MNFKMVSNKNKLTDIYPVWIKGKNTEQDNLIVADSVEYIHNKKGDFFDHHLMFYWKKHLAFKVWLRNKPTDKPYKNIQEALKDVGIRINETNRRR